MTETSTPYDYSKMAIPVSDSNLHALVFDPLYPDNQTLREEVLGWHHKATELEKANAKLEQQVAGLMAQIDQLNSRISALAVENVRLLNPGCKPRSTRKYPEKNHE